ncbi:MAG: Ig-like domain-containing protein, partial [Bacillota bacterium]|nr:Ig-like domain-containing protein [Bacillota bacterium]
SLDTTAATLAQGATKQLVVTGTMSDGSTKDITNSSEGTTYTSSNSAVATVDANGLITVLPTATVGYKTVILANNNGKTASCTVTVGSAAVTVNSISLDTTAATLAQGATKQLVVTGTMSDGSTKDITNSSTGTTYTSSNASVATVDANGLITVLPTATVGYKTVISAKNNGKTASCTVTVGSAAVTVNSISLDATAATIGQGVTKQLVVTGVMSDGSTQDITNSSTGTTYTSSNLAVATVDANGLITVLPPATVGYKTVITAKNNGKTASCTVTVGSGAVTVNSISLDTTAATIVQGATKQLVVTGTMSDGSTKDVTNSSTGTTYTSSNTAVATVDANGLITVLPTATVGYKTVISVKNNGKTASCTVTVGSAVVTVNSISLDTTAATIVQGATKQLVVTGSMSDGSTKDLTNSSTGTTYTSSNTAVATVDANGLVTVLPTATVGYKTVISAKNNGKTVSCTVTVGSTGVAVNSISLDSTAVAIGQGLTKQLIVTGAMSDGSTKDITNSSTGTIYTSSNLAVATVDANGLITVSPTAISGYKTVITVKNGTKTASCTVTAGISGPTVTSISANLSTVTLAKGATQQLNVTATMSDSSTKDVTNSSTGTTYASSNTAVATVDANGLITILPTATSGYKCNITINNNGKIITCTVTVAP